ncbi:MAG: PqqD family protein [Dehalococcoidia bacterium]|nr:PqqD family protein [Dehalococcoidia bacterium]
MFQVSGNLHVDDNGFVFDSNSGLSYALNRTGTLVLKRLLSHTMDTMEMVPVAEIAGALMDAYGISRSTALSDVNEFIDHLHSIHLVTLRGQ